MQEPVFYRGLCGFHEVRVFNHCCNRSYNESWLNPMGLGRAFQILLGLVQSVPTHLVGSGYETNNSSDPSTSSKLQGPRHSSPPQIPIIKNQDRSTTSHTRDWARPEPSLMFSYLYLFWPWVMAAFEARQKWTYFSSTYLYWLVMLAIKARILFMSWTNGN